MCVCVRHTDPLPARSDPFPGKKLVASGTSRRSRVGSSLNLFRFRDLERRKRWGRGGLVGESLLENAIALLKVRSPPSWLCLISGEWGGRVRGIGAPWTPLGTKCGNPLAGPEGSPASLEAGRLRFCSSRQTKQARNSREKKKRWFHLPWG